MLEGQGVIQGDLQPDARSQARSRFHQSRKGTVAALAA